MIDVYKYKIANEKAEVLYDVMAQIDEILSLTAGSIVSLVTTLPAIGTDAQVVFNTTDNKLYIYANAQWNVITGEPQGGTTIPTVVALPADNSNSELVIYMGSLYVWNGAQWDKVGVNATSSSNGGFVNTIPTNPTIGDIVVDLVGGNTQTWDGTQWVVDNYTPTASAVTKINVVNALPNPTTSTDGDLVYNTSDGQTYILSSGAWVNLGSTVTPTASSANSIEIVSTLPLTVTNGSVLYNSTDKKLYEGVNGVWTQVVAATGAAATVADASLTTAKFASGLTPTEIVDALPTTGNFNGRIAYLTTDGKLYRYVNTAWTSAVPAVDVTGTISGTQIADGAISTQHITANSITSDMIQANSITASMLTADALNVGTVAAGAITATELASGAVTTDKLYAGAVTATKIASNSIDATKIIAGSISGDRIAANAITAGHIQAGAITSSEISAGAISADKIATNSISAAKIQAGAVGASEISANAITADKVATGSIVSSKLSVDALDGKSAAFTGSRAYDGGAYWTLSTNSGIHSTGTTYGIVGKASGHGIFGYTTGTAPSVGVLGQASGIAIQGISTGGSHGFYTGNTIHAGAGYLPFTGSHITYSKDRSLQVGQIVSSDDAWVAEINNALIHTSKSTLKDTRVIGVVCEIKNTLMDNLERNETVCNIERATDLSKTDTYTIKPEFQSYIDYMKTNNFREVQINSLGEGGILVSNENGNINNGDYITSGSNGYGIKQDDDLLHSYTVAKALESVDWTNESSTTKMIACTYHCG